MGWLRQAVQPSRQHGKEVELCEHTKHGLTLLGYTERSREKSSRATRGYRMTWHIPLAMIRRDEVEDEDEAFQTTQQRQEKRRCVDVG